MKGAVLATFSIIIVYAVAYYVVYWLIPYWLANLILQSLIVFFCLAGHTLRNEVKAVFAALESSLHEGRRQVSRIVGRDTTNLTPQKVRTAALETLAENVSDGVVAPIFYLALLGVPGMLAYKMVNTLDSMIAYRTERYRKFGCFAARIDDVANWIPARITAFLMLIVGYVYMKTNPKQFVRTIPFREMVHFVVHFGPQHASPNSGWPEAALAVLLDCRFGGTHDYFGESIPKPYIGTNPRPLSATDLNTSLRFSFATECLAVAIVAVALYTISQVM